MSKKNTLISLLIIAIAAASFGYYLYNKGPLNVESSSAINTNATELYNQFNKDSVGSLKQYAGKVLQVSGEINSISLNQKKEKIILLKTGTAGAYINCSMEADPGEVHVNDKVNIKGICSGRGQGDTDIGISGDLYLTRCYLIK